MSCYNAVPWLHEAICSILSQTFQNFEIVLVDDGSTDDTPDVIRRYAARDRRIVVISKTNSGLADSLNAGIAQAKGHWIARLDADDQCLPTRLEMQIRFLHNNPALVLLGSGFVEIDGTGGLVGNRRYPGQHRRLVRNLQRMMRFFPHSSAIFKREIALSAGSYNPLFRKAQDWDLWLRLSESGAIACLPDPLVKIRKHHAQISASADGYQQLVYGTAASVCHFLRTGGIQVTPANDSTGDDVWPRFLAWIDRRLREEGILARRKVWGDLRSSSSGNQSSLIRLLGFGKNLWKSGQVTILLEEKLAGIALPKYLAREWASLSYHGSPE